MMREQPIWPDGGSSKRATSQSEHVRAENDAPFLKCFFGRDYGDIRVIGKCIESSGSR
jgi:hypothetical protein